MAFPTNNTLLDNFNRASLGSNWTQGIYGGEALSIQASDSLRNVSGWGSAIYNVSTYGPDIEYQTTIDANGTGEWAYRLTGSQNTMNGYFWHYGGANVGLWKMTGGGQVSIGATVAVTFAVGDKVGIEVIGNTHNFYKQTGGAGAWNLIVSRSDSSHTGAGYIGFLLNGLWLDDLTGGTVITSTDTSDTRDVRVRGQADSSTTRDVRATGVLASSTTRDARITGIDVGSSDARDVRVRGQADNNTTRDVRVTGILPSSDTRDVRLVGVADSYRDLVVSHGASHLWGLDEVDGVTTAKDSIGSFDGTYVNGGTQDDGIPGRPGDKGRYLAEASNQHITIPGFDNPGNVSSWTHAGDFTLEIWYKRPSSQVGVTDEGIIGGWVAATGGGPMIWIAYGTDKYGATLGFGGGEYITTTISPSYDEWDHLVLTVQSEGWGNDSYGELYINGQLAGSNSAPLGGPPMFEIGRYSADNSLDLTGTITEAAFYPNTLTAQEIEEHYILGLGLIETSETRDVRATGKADSSDSRDVRTTGKATSDAARDARVTGGFAFGHFEIGTTPQAIGQHYPFGNVHTSPVDGNITKIRAYLDNPAGGGAQVLRAVIYPADANVPDDPGVVKGVSTEVTITDGQAPGWVTFDFPSPVAVSDEEELLLGLWGGGNDAQARLYEIDSSPSPNVNFYFNSTYHSTNNPGNWSGSSNTEGISWSLYAIYDPAGFGGIEAQFSWTEIEVPLEDQNVVFDTRDVRVTGQAVSTADREVRVTGKLDSTVDREVRARGQADSSHAQDARLRGQAVSSVERDARVRGQAVSSDTRDARVRGAAASTDTRDVRVRGRADSSIDRDVRITGKLDSFATRDVRLSGTIPSSAERDVRVTGFSDAVTVAVDARLRGQAVSNAVRDVRITAQAASAFAIDARLIGTADSFIVRDVRLRGTADTSVERDARATGQLSAEHAVDVRLFGHYVTSVERTVKLTGSPSVPTRYGPGAAGVAQGRGRGGLGNQTGEAGVGREGASGGLRAHVTESGLIIYTKRTETL